MLVPAPSVGFSSPLAADALSPRGLPSRRAASSMCPEASTMVTTQASVASAKESSAALLPPWVPRLRAVS